MVRSNSDDDLDDESGDGPVDDAPYGAMSDDVRDRRLSSARMQLGMGACAAVLGLLAVLAVTSVPEGVSFAGPAALTAVGVAIAGHALWRLRRLKSG